jgi:pyruvate dehydrogenase E2 component (dihydrolipoamide acetyltransferase)
MPTNVIMPALGVAQQTGTLLKWLKAEGESVSKGEPLMEIETDKATVEIEAPGSGILSCVTAKPGDQVPVGERIAFILAPGEVASEDQDRVSVSASPIKPVTQPNPRISPFVKGESKGNFLSPDPSPPPPRTRILASPAARRIAKEGGIDITSCAGTGPDGAVLAEDVLRSMTGQAAAPRGPAKVEEILPLTPMRRTIAERMTHSKQMAPHFYLSIDVDMSAIIKLRAEQPENQASRAPSVNDYILRACARTLKDFPLLNASYTEHGIELHREINIGMAVALEEGLVVPVIRNADRLNVNQLAERSRELQAKAQTKKLYPADYDGGTFTVSNLGMLGVDSFIAIINPPQCAILAVGRVAPRVVVEDDMFTIKAMMTTTLSADHRIIDGATGARFLQQIKSRLEEAEF